MTVTELIERYEIPEEYHLAMFDAYTAGLTKGYVECLKVIDEVSNG